MCATRDRPVWGGCFGASGRVPSAIYLCLILCSTAHRTRASERAPLVDFRSVTVQYNAHVVFDNLKWMVREGEKWVVLGGNGQCKPNHEHARSVAHHVREPPRKHLHAQARASRLSSS